MLTQKQLSENVFIDERRPVLLCDGKLCLRALQDLFNLTIVEMMYGMFTKLDLASVGQQKQSIANSTSSATCFLSFVRFKWHFPSCKAAPKLPLSKSLICCFSCAINRVVTQGVKG